MSGWFEITNENSGIALSVRVRLARNLKDYPFPQRMNRGEKTEVANRVKNALCGGNSYLSELLSFYTPEKFSETELISMAEQNLISPEFINDQGGKGLVLSKDRKTSIMINEEDHIRIQVISNSLKDAFDSADKIDIVLGETIEMAYDNRLGYLTQCPTNLGTAMRASIMLHLPGLTETGAMARISSNLTKLGITVRGSHGEGTKVQGDIYQISNQITLGLSESESIENLSGIANQIITDEMRARGEMLKSPDFIDKMYRTLGIIKYARAISSRELADSLSIIRVGLTAGILKGIETEELLKLYFDTMPASLIIGRSLSNLEKRDFERGDLVREKLKNLE